MEKSRNSQELMCENVEAFSIKFGIPQLEESGFLEPDDMMFRLEFIQEEMDEFTEAYNERDLAGALDALVDIMYVAIGTAYMMNLPILDAWERVHHANMQKVKVKNVSESKRGSIHDLRKPEGWTPPDLSDLV